MSSFYGILAGVALAALLTGALYGWGPWGNRRRVVRYPILWNVLDVLIVAALLMYVLRGLL